MKCKYKVIKKRDGSIVNFDDIKITTALYYVFKEVHGKAKRSDVKPYISKIVSLTNSLDKEEVSVEDIQDCVEKTLVAENLYAEAKAYILYREKHDAERNHRYVYAEKLVSDYMDKSDWRVKENANSGYSFPSLVNHISGSVLASYALNKMYPKHIADAHTNGDLHIHDLSCSVIGYCSGWSLKDLLMKGFKGVDGRASAKPAKHLDTALLQMVNFIMTLQTEFAGAQAFNSVDTLLAPFVRKDNLSYKEVKQKIQQMVFGLNIAARLGQASFSNLSFDWVVPEDMKEYPVIYDGKYSETETYESYQPEMDMINKAFIEVMMEGDSDGKLFSFPIPTYSITPEFNWDSENTKLLFQMTAKYGIPYFQNFVSSGLHTSDIRSMCCRLSLNLNELRKKTGGLFGFNDNTGSIGVVTINLPRLGYLAKDEKDLYERLDSLMDIAKDSLEIKREYVKRNFDEGLMPYTKVYLTGFDNYFSTIGVVGANEMCLNFMGKSLIEQEAIDFTQKILNHMKDRLVLYQEETGNIYNIEAAPAEGTAYRLARIDKRMYPDIQQAGKEDTYYTNSTQLPVWYTDNIYEYLDKQEGLQCTYTGGSVFHAYVGEEVTPEQAMYMIKHTFENYAIPYMSISTIFSICPKHKYLPGIHFTCPICAKENN